ncbi:MAG: EAL and HDOD domain-containing protein [Bradymonadia bacterium]
MEVFVARQPIFDRKRSVVAYELLFRSGPENFFDLSQDPDIACSRIISDQLHVFEDGVTNGRRAFINTTRRILVDGMIEMLPPANTVVEILEDVEPDPELLRAIKGLKQAGYKIALDDFVYRPSLKPFIELADIIKIDFLTTQGRDRVRIARQLQRQKITLLAEKVETVDDFREAYQAGYSMFQGYFFCRPEMISRQSIPAFKGNYLKLLSVLNKPDINFNQVAEIIRLEPSLSVKLLKYLNSAAFGLRQRVSSIRQGLVLLGHQPLKKWASLVALTGIGEDKPPELVLTALQRARMCELIAESSSLKPRTFDLFLVGLFSVMDAMVNRPMDELIGSLGLAQDVHDALVFRNNPMGHALALCQHYAEGEWDKACAVSNRLGLQEKRLPEMYQESLGWAEQINAV